MNYLKTTLILSVLICFSSCAEPGTENTTSEEATTAAEPEMDVVEEENALQLRNEIEEYRKTVENTKSDLEKGSIDLSTARVELSQDWQKLDFYKIGDKVVRIKSYPSTAKSKTEEFYFIDDELVFALVESEGTEKDSMEDEDSGDAFYYSEGELIVSTDFEVTEATDEEKSAMAMGTKLQNEAKEYLQLIYESKD
jgi:hypothetical protein